MNTKNSDPILAHLNTTKSDIHQAWLECQKELPNPKEKSHGNYGEYASLEQILRTCRPILHRHHFTLKQTVLSFEGHPWMLTRLTYKNGETIQIRIPMYGDFKDMQKFGAAITYARRYSLNMLFGTEGEKDLDSLPMENNPHSEPPTDRDWRTYRITLAPGNLFNGKKLSEVPEKALTKDYNYWKDRLQNDGKIHHNSQLFLDMVDQMRASVKAQIDPSRGAFPDTDL